MKWGVKVAKRAVKEIKKVPQKDAQRLLFVLDEMLENPFIANITGGYIIYHK